MKKSNYIFIIIMLLQSSCNSSSENHIKRIDGSKIEEQILDERISFLMDEAKVTGLNVAIFNDGEVVYQKAFGYSNIESRDALDVNQIIYGASFSKAVYGYLISKLVQEGILDIDKELYKYLDVDLPDLYIDKEFRRLHDLKEDERYKQITARMCVTYPKL
jgi:CubicO group peptidase (beta-lactamase class C family)